MPRTRHRRPPAVRPVDLRRRARPSSLPRAFATAALAALGALVPPAARAEPAGACHCFRDRTWEPERPAAADPYILATARSSLLSAAFGASKASLVAAAMGGAQPEDLWIAHAAAAWSGGDASSLLAVRQARGGWAAALAGAKGLPPAVEASLRAGAAPQPLMTAVVDEVLVHRLGASPAGLAALRAAGARPEEVVLGAILGAHLGAPVAPLVAEVHAGRATWGGVLHDAGLTPKGLDPLVRRLVHPG